MASESENPEPAPTPEPTLDQRLKVLESNESRAFESVKFGLTTFTLIAGLLIAHNWWSAKTNYEREKEYFQNQLALTQRESALSNDKQSAELRKQAESSIIANSNNLQNAFVSLQQQNDARWTNMMAGLTNAISVLGTGLGTNVANGLQNNITQLNVAFTNEMNAINQALKVHREALETTLTNVEARVTDAINGITGQALMLQGNSILKVPRASQNVNLAQGVSSLLEATHVLFLAKDESNLRRCLNTLRQNALLELIKKTSKAEFAHYESRLQIADKMRIVISDLEKANGTGAYEDNITGLKYYLEIIQGKLPMK